LAGKSFTYNTDKYNILNKISSGSYGEVYIIQNLTNTVNYTLKAVTNMSSDAKEINILNKLSNIPSEDQRRHNVIKIFSDAFSLPQYKDYFGFFILEYADGILDGTRYTPPDLYAYINVCKKKNMVDLHKISNIFLQMYDGLCFCHDNSVIHLDIKPDNFVIAGGVIKLVDFGLSEYDWDESGAPKKLTERGSAPYMPPETFVGGGFGEKTDFWALGVTLYHLVTLNKPFNGTNLVQLYHDIEANNPQSIIGQGGGGRTLKVSGIENKLDKTMDTAMVNQLITLQQMGLKELKNITGGKVNMLGGTLPDRVGDISILDIIQDIINGLLVSDYSQRYNRENIDKIELLRSTINRIDLAVVKAEIEAVREELGLG